MAIFAGIEAGGTKFVCAVGSGPEDLRDVTSFPTTTPAETLDTAVEFFKSRGPLDAVGIASFGPVDPDPSSAKFGFITTTPKKGWADTDLCGAVRRALTTHISAVSSPDGVVTVTT